MKVLFIGGTGVISSACARQAVVRGMELYLLNRGQTSRPIPEGAQALQGDIRDRGIIKKKLTSLMLGRQERVFIENYLIRARESD